MNMPRLTPPLSSATHNELLKKGHETLHKLEITPRDIVAIGGFALLLNGINMHVPKLSEGFDVEGFITRQAHARLEPLCASGVVPPLQLDVEANVKGNPLPFTGICVDYARSGGRPLPPWKDIWEMSDEAPDDFRTMPVGEVIRLKAQLARPKDIAGILQWYVQDCLTRGDTDVASRHPFLDTEEWLSHVGTCMSHIRLLQEIGGDTALEEYPQWIQEVGAADFGHTLFEPVKAHIADVAARDY